MEDAWRNILKFSSEVRRLMSMVSIWTNKLAIKASKNMSELRELYDMDRLDLVRQIRLRRGLLVRIVRCEDKHLAARAGLTKEFGMLLADHMNWCQQDFSAILNTTFLRWLDTSREDLCLYNLKKSGKNFTSSLDEICIVKLILAGLAIYASRGMGSIYMLGMYSRLIKAANDSPVGDPRIFLRSVDRHRAVEALAVVCVLHRSDLITILLDRVTVEPSKCLEMACKTGNLPLILTMIRAKCRWAMSDVVNLYRASRETFLRIFSLIPPQGQTSMLLYSAVGAEGDLEVIQLLLKTHTHLTPDLFLGSACSYYRLETVSWLASIGAVICTNCHGVLRCGSAPRASASSGIGV